jgi:mRNA-degrading endonuclease RelE of RelBE toxin-antitoxin system
MDKVELSSKQDQIYDIIDLLPSMPVLGSTNLPVSVQKDYGDNVRKLVISHFLVIYEILEDEDAFLLLGLVPQRAAW